MTDRPILFSGPMVRANLEGRKTQTRRVLKPQPPVGMDLANIYAPGLTAVFECQTPIHTRGDHIVPLRYMPGDRLWVRETWSDVNLDGGPGLALRATNETLDLMERSEFLCPDGSFNYDDTRLTFGERGLMWSAWADDLHNGVEGRWRPGIHMPRWASRLTCVVTDVRVQRLQDISEEDAMAEGVERRYSDTCHGMYRDYLNEGYGQGCTFARDSFHTLWDSINAKRENGIYAWDANPWVVAVTFDPHQINIDKMQEAA